jgi:hypothetical protein
MPTGIATMRCGTNTSTDIRQVIRTRTMPMSIQMERHSECRKSVLTGTPIRTYTNLLPTPIPMSAMNTIGINTPTNLTLTPRNPLKNQRVRRSYFPGVTMSAA